MLLPSEVARAEIEFVGVITRGLEHRFALRDSVTGRTAWVGIGDSFSHYALMGFEPSQDVLMLQQGRTAVRIRLKDPAKIQSAVELSGTFVVIAGSATRAVATTFFCDQETRFMLGDGMECRVKPRRRVDGNINYVIELQRSGDVFVHQRISVIAAPEEPFAAGDAGLLVRFTPASR